MGALFIGDLETLLTTGLLAVLVDYKSDFTVDTSTGEVTYDNADADVVIQTIESIQIQVTPQHCFLLISMNKMFLSSSF